MMNSNTEDYERLFNIIERTLLEESIPQSHFKNFQAALQNISKISLSYTESPDKYSFLQTAINTLKRGFQQNTDTGSFERTQYGSLSVFASLKQEYKLKHQAANAGKVFVPEDQADTIAEDYKLKHQARNAGKVLVPEDPADTTVDPKSQSSLSTSNENEEEKQMYTLVKDKNDRKLQFKEEQDNLRKGEAKNLTTGDNHQIKAEPQFITSTVKSQLNDKEELQKMLKEIAGLKEEIVTKNQVILDLNMKLMQQTTQNEGTKEHLKTVISQLETRTTEARSNKEELARKTQEIENLNKKITDIQKQNITDLSVRDMLQYKLSFLQQELQKKNDDSNSLMSRLITKEEQLKKLELEIETQKNVAKYESRQHQEKSNELQEFRSKSAELINNLRAKGDELISKLLELSECKNDLVKYANVNGSQAKQLTLLEKKYEDLDSKLKIDSTNYQKEITSLKEQLVSERKSFRELNEQNDSVKEELKTQKENCNYLESRNMDLQSKLSETLADLGEVNVNMRKLEHEIKSIQDNNSKLNQELERVNSQLRSVNNQRLSAEEQNKIVSNKLSEVESEINQMKKTLDDTEEELKVCNDRLCDEKDNNIKFKRMFEFYLSKLNDNREELRAIIDTLFRSQTLEEIRKDEREKVKEATLQKLNDIKSEVDGYKEGVRKFSGNKTNKAFLNLQEMIQRCIGKIDQIQSENILEIQAKKKEVIEYCEIVDAELQRKATSAGAY